MLLLLRRSKCRAQVRHVKARELESWRVEGDVFRTGLAVDATSAVVASVTPGAMGAADYGGPVEKA